MNIKKALAALAIVCGLAPAAFASTIHYIVRWDATDTNWLQWPNTNWTSQSATPDEFRVYVDSTTNAITAFDIDLPQSHATGTTHLFATLHITNVTGSLDVSTHTATWHFSAYFQFTGSALSSTCESPSSSFTFSGDYIAPSYVTIRLEALTNLPFGPHTCISDYANVNSWLGLGGNLQLHFNKMDVTVLN